MSQAERTRPFDAARARAPAETAAETAAEAATEAATEPAIETAIARAADATVGVVTDAPGRPAEPRAAEPTRASDARRPAEPPRQADIATLRARLQETEETLRAIRLGEVDALVIQGPSGPQTYTLVTADQSYRMLVEQMREAALTLSREGVILYCNGRLTSLLQLPPGALTGRPLIDLAVAEDRENLAQLLEVGATGATTGEVRLCRSDEEPVPVEFSLSPLQNGGFSGICGVATDLTARRLRDQAAAEERLTRGILEFAGTAIVVCDAAGRIVRTNRMATDLCGEDLLGRTVESVFRLSFRDVTAEAASPATEHEVSCVQPDGRELFLIMRLRPVGDFIGSAEQRWVITMTDITERRQVEAERLQLLEAERAARAEAEATSRAKSQFLAVMSHELRTPLSAVVGYAELLRDGVCGMLNEVQRSHLNRVTVSAQYLVTIIDEILTFARMQAGKETAELDVTDVRTIVNDTVALFEVQTQAKGIGLRVELPDLLEVRTDGGKLRQIAVNLIGNAVKFTDRGEVRIELGAEPGWVILRVHDTGEGIAPEDRERIFDAFTQVDGSTTRRKQGTGLGLTVSRDLARLLGGDITLESSPGRGSTFILRLPDGSAA
jgi:PAS domain S-box-containing protein